MRLAFAACCISLCVVSTTATAQGRDEILAGIRTCDSNVAQLASALGIILPGGLERRAVTQVTLPEGGALHIGGLTRRVRLIQNNCTRLGRLRDLPLGPRARREIDSILERNPDLIKQAWDEIARINARRGAPNVSERLGPFGPRGVGSTVATPVIYADLGFPWRGDSDLPNSNQYVVHTGNIAGGIGGVYSFPGSTGFFERGFWWAIGFYFTYIHSSPMEVRNRAVPGVLPLSGGHSDTTAGFITGGFRARPFGGALSPFELMLLGGLGLAYNNTSLLGATGTELLFSRYTALAWMGRGALKYWINDYVALGLFAAYIGAQQGYATLTGTGTSVPYGGPSIWLLGLTLTIALH